MKDVFAFLNSVTTYLSSTAVGTIGTDLFKGQMPGSPIVGTVVALSGGFDEIGNPTRLVNITIQHRNTHIESGLPKIVEINNLMDDQWNILEDFPGRFTANSEPGQSFKDDNGHYVFPLNYLFTSTTQN